MAANITLCSWLNCNTFHTATYQQTRKLISQTANIPSSKNAYARTLYTCTHMQIQMQQIDTSYTKVQVVDMFELFESFYCGCSFSGRFDCIYLYIYIYVCVAAPLSMALLALHMCVTVVPMGNCYAFASAFFHYFFYLSYYYCCYSFCCRCKCSLDNLLLKVLT